MTIYCSQCGVANDAQSQYCQNCRAPIARPAYEAGEHQGGNDVSGFQFRLSSIVIAIICGIYLINPTFGMLEFIPDNIPIIGNLDEAAAATGLLMALSNLGIIPWRRE